MPVKQFKPTSAGRRGASGYAFTEITKSTSEPSLTVSKSKSGGRNNRGITTIRYRGGGSRRNIRVIDFKRDKVGVPGRVASIEYDPKRTARIALIFYRDGEKRYILAPVGLQVNDMVQAGTGARIWGWYPPAVRGKAHGDGGGEREGGGGRGGGKGREGGGSAPP